MRHCALRKRRADKQWTRGNQGLKAQRWDGMHKTMQTPHAPGATPGARGLRRPTLGAGCGQPL